jgi:hypothetical protein
MTPDEVMARIAATLEEEGERLRAQAYAQTFRPVGFPPALHLAPYACYHEIGRAPAPHTNYMEMALKESVDQVLEQMRKES